MTFRTPPNGEIYGGTAGSHWSDPRTGTDGARPFQWTQTGAPVREGGGARVPPFGTTLQSSLH